MLDQYVFRNAKILRSQGKSYESGWQVFQQDDKQFTVSTARVAYVSTEQLLDWINQTRNWNPSSSASHWHPAYSDTEPTFACSLSTRPLSPLSLTPQWNILRRGCKEHHHFLNCFWKPGNAGIIKMQLSCWNELPKHRCKNQVHYVNDLTEKQQDTYLLPGFQSPFTFARTSDIRTELTQALQKTTILCKSYCRWVEHIKGQQH